jgi:uncharacterized protein (TIGR02677 family)
MAVQRVWRSIDADLFRFTTTDLREQHLALMAAFEEAAVLAPALNLDQVRTALSDVGWDEPIDDAVLERALSSLVGWDLLEATQDHAAHYSTPEEFERKNLQWSLTRRGEAAVSGVLHALTELRHAVGLQPAVLDAIGDALVELADLSAQPDTPATNARIHILLAEVEGHLGALVTSVRQFNGHLQRLLREDATDDTVFADVKRRTVAYLEQYVDGVERPQRRLVTAVERLAALGLANLFDRALVGANLAPVAGGDPAPSWLAERNRRWVALRAWFAPDDGRLPRISGLLDIARTAIVELLRVLERRWDSRRRSASVATDFRRLASWFEAAPGDDEAHRLFGAAFGMWPSRHAHLIAVDGEARSPNTSWTIADPVDVAPALRTTGRLSNTGQTRSVADPAFVRASRQLAQAKIMGEHDVIRASLITYGAVRLSAIRRLPTEAFAEFLALLATGLDAPLAADGTRRAVSVDGRVEVALRDPHDGSRASLRSDIGVLHGPDMFVTIVLVGSDVGHSTAEEATGA